MQIVIFLTIVSLLIYESFGLFYNAHTKVGIIIGQYKAVTLKDRTYQIINYLGIPYAAEPSGNQRFRKPFPAEPFKQPYNATFFRPACLQTGFGQTKQVTSENCLHLNVYAPADTTSDPDKKYPVLIFIHGGRFLVGASNDYSPNVLVGANDVIVVSINYRLSVFGFLSSGEPNAPGNFGLWDQHLAIKWVRHNIHSLGGDTDRITLFGQSAGSASALYHALYPGNRGLFQRVIAISGSALSPWALHKPNAAAFAKELGCVPFDIMVENNTIDENVTMIDCLRSKPASELLEATQHISNEGPAIDGEFILEHPHEILFPNNGFPVPPVGPMDPGSFPGGTHHLDPHSHKLRDSLEFFKSLDLISGVTNMDGTKNLFTLLTSTFGTVDFNNVTITEDEFKHALVPTLIDTIFRHQEVHHDHKPVGFKTFESVVQSVIFQYTNWTDPKNYKHRRNNALKLATHVDYAIPTLQTVDAHTGANGSTYFYEFTHNPTFRFYNPPWVTGAGHGSELFFMFGFAPEMLHELGLTKHFVSEAEVDLSINMMKWISNFAKSGDPNKPKPLTLQRPKYNFTLNRPYLQWPKYNATDRPYLQLKTHLSTNDVKIRYGEPYTAFWLKLVPELLSPGITTRFGGGWNPGVPDLEGVQFSSEYINTRVSNEVFISLIVGLGAFAILTFFLVASICRHKKSSTPQGTPSS